jgi:hypothetical protein
LPNTRLQPTWPRLKERTLDCRFGFLLKWSLLSESGQAAEPPAVGPHGQNNLQTFLQFIARIWNKPISFLMQWELDLEMLQPNGFVIVEGVSLSIKLTYKKKHQGHWIME